MIKNCSTKGDLYITKPGNFIQNNEFTSVLIFVAFDQMW